MTRLPEQSTATTSVRLELCPHCGKPTAYSFEQEEWVCPFCGYEGLQPEDPMNYVLPPMAR